MHHLRTEAPLDRRAGISADSEATSGLQGKGSVLVSGYRPQRSTIFQRVDMTTFEVRFLFFNMGTRIWKTKVKNMMFALEAGREGSRQFVMKAPGGRFLGGVVYEKKSRRQWEVRAILFASPRDAEQPEWIPYQPEWIPYQEVDPAIIQLWLSQIAQFQTPKAMRVPDREVMRFPAR